MWGEGVGEGAAQPNGGECGDHPPAFTHFSTPTCTKEDSRGPPVLWSTPASTICSVSTSFATWSHKCGRASAIRHVRALILFGLPSPQRPAVSPPALRPRFLCREELSPPCSPPFLFLPPPPPPSPPHGSQPHLALSAEAPLLVPRAGKVPRAPCQQRHRQAAAEYWARRVKDGGLFRPRIPLRERPDVTARKQRIPFHTFQPLPHPSAPPPTPPPHPSTPSAQSSHAPGGGPTGRRPEPPAACG